MSEWGSDPKLHFTLNISAGYLFSVHLQKSWRKEVQYSTQISTSSYWGSEFSTCEISMSLYLCGKLDKDDYSSPPFWGKYPPKGQAVTSPVFLLCQLPQLLKQRRPMLAGWGSGSWSLGGCSLLPSEPASLSRQTLSSAHQCPPWPGVGLVSLDEWSPNCSAGSLLETALPLPGTPSGKREPMVCKLSFRNRINTFQEMLSRHPQPFRNSARNKKEAVKLLWGEGEEDVLKPKVASWSFLYPQIRGKGILFYEEDIFIRQLHLEAVLLHDRNAIVMPISDRFMKLKWPVLSLLPEVL